MSTARIFNQTLLNNNTLIQLSLSAGTSASDYISKANAACSTTLQNVSSTCVNAYPAIYEYVSNCGTSLQTFYCDSAESIAPAVFDCINKAWGQQTHDACPARVTGLDTASIAVITAAGALFLGCTAWGISRWFTRTPRPDAPAPQVEMQTPRP